MYAIIRTGGKQYHVEEGDVLRVEKLPGEVGDTVSLGDVLLDLGRRTGRCWSARGRGGFGYRGDPVNKGRAAKDYHPSRKRRRKGYRVKRGHATVHSPWISRKINPVCPETPFYAMKRKKQGGTQACLEGNFGGVSKGRE